MPKLPGPSCEGKEVKTEPKPLRKHINITIQETVLEELHRIANEESRSVSSLINKVIRDWLKERRKP